MANIMLNSTFNVGCPWIPHLTWLQLEVAPWQGKDEAKLVTWSLMQLETYRPEEVVTETGALFHVIIKHYDTGNLSTYLTRVYKPAKVKTISGVFLGKKNHLVGQTILTG